MYAPAGTALPSPIDMQPALAPPPGARARACLRLHLTELTVRADLRPPASYRLRLALHAVALTARELGGAAPPAPPLLELVPPRAKPLRRAAKAVPGGHNDTCPRTRCVASASGRRAPGWPWPFGPESFASS